MKMIQSKKIIYFSLTFITMLILSSCIDDFDRMEEIPYKDGIATINVELNYVPEVNIRLTSRAYQGGDDGNTIRNIESLVMLVYDGDELYDKYVIIGGVPHKDISEVINYADEDNRLPSEGNLTDDKTGKVTFKLKIHSGKNYNIYAVANMGVLDEYENDIQTRDGLKKISCEWNVGKISENSQMFGVFSLTPNRDANDSNPLIISAYTPSLHCWVNRLASKVTVAFDGTELYENVQVYVTDIYLKDIPRYCSLGIDNVPGKDVNGEEISVENRYVNQNGGLIEDGGHIVIQTLPEDLSLIPVGNYIHLCNSDHSYLGAYANNSDPNTVENTHVNTAPSLFFYENKQGTGKSKKQDAINNETKEEGSDNKIDYPSPDIDKVGSGWKDEKPFGTYVEVHGFYRSTTADGHVSSGPIKYRFMLGQDVDKNYDAIRNHHYQLTLAFKGYGNDADWHIEYEEKRGVVAASPQYISYLYGKKMVTTVKVNGRIQPGTSLTAHIIDVDDSEYDSKEDTFWRPWGEVGSTSFPAVQPSDEWSGIDYFYTGTVHGEGAHQSFLSLWETKAIQILPPDKYKGKPSWDVPFNEALAESIKYYDENGIGDRTYSIGEDQSDELQMPGGTGDDTHTVIVSKRNSSGEPIERVFKIPLYTREKELVTRTGFTGNNPYYSYPRRQRVKFTASVWNEEKGIYEPSSLIVEIIQVRRIINPKGVWRSSGTEPFTVRLLRLKGDSQNEDFTDFTSEGAWSAEIMTNPNGIISLSSTREGSGDDAAPQVHVNRVQGASELPIDFKINFTGATGCAIVRVRYHNYTCEHDIFCRNGYDPIALRSGDAEWSSYNVDHFENGKAVMTNSPLDEGSMFRRNSNIAITSENNALYPRPIGPNRYNPSGNFRVIKADGTAGTLSWADTKGEYTGTENHEWKITNENYRIATIDEFLQLTASNNNIDFPINKAYGIIYGDGATGVQYKRVDAYGYMKNSTGKSEKGMVGIIAYNSQNANQIFFPLGTEGAGRRKGGGDPNDTGLNRDYAGTLRYSSRSEWYGYRAADSEPPQSGAWNYNYFVLPDKSLGTPIGFQPMFYDLYRRPGAVYWCYEWSTEGNNGLNHSSAFDMNFFTMGFEGFQNGAAPTDANKSDACFIRLVKIPSDKTQ